MKITIGSLIRKELARPDSEMSVRSRRFKTYAYLCKKNPKVFKMEFGGLWGDKLSFYKKDNKRWFDAFPYGYKTKTIGEILGFYDRKNSSI